MVKSKKLDAAIEELAGAIAFGRNSGIIYRASAVSVAASELAHELIQRVARDLQADENATL